MMQHPAPSSVWAGLVHVLALLACCSLVTATKHQYEGYTVHVIFSNHLVRMQDPDHAMSATPADPHPALCLLLPCLPATLALTRMSASRNWTPRSSTFTSTSTCCTR